MMPGPARRRLRHCAARKVFVLSCLLLAPAGAARGATPPQLAPCHLDGLAEEVRCGRFEVWEDRQRAAGRRLSLAFAVLPARRSEAVAPPLFLLAGGPGQGARSYARLVARFFDRLRERRAVVLVDLRGSGDSHPLDCAGEGDELAAFGPGGSLALDVGACLRGLDAEPRLYTSESQMADLDELRAALGYPRIDLWGGSFGTRAALVYALRYPDHLGRLVLDGAAPFELEFPAATAVDAQSALDRLLADCAAKPACAERYPGLGTSLERLLARLAASPATAEVRHPRTGAPSEITVTRQAFASGLRLFLYSPFYQSLIPWVVSAAEAGNFGPFVALYGEGLTSSVDTMALGLTLSVVCAEDVSRLDPQAAEAAAASTFLGTAELHEWQRWCEEWPAGRLSSDLPTAAPSSAPALILSGALDPVTPPRWGEVMARHFRSPALVVVPGAAHNTSFSGCVPELIAHFLDHGSLAGFDLGCVAQVQRPPFVLGLGGTP